MKRRSTKPVYGKTDIDFALQRLDDLRAKMKAHEEAFGAEGRQAIGITYAPEARSKVAILDATNTPRPDWIEEMKSFGWAG